jgi:hypothetical protein
LNFRIASSHWVDPEARAVRWAGHGSDFMVTLSLRTAEASLTRGVGAQHALGRASQALLECLGNCCHARGPGLKSREPVIRIRQAMAAVDTIGKEYGEGGREGWEFVINVAAGLAIVILEIDHEDPSASRLHHAHIGQAIAWVQRGGIWTRLGLEHTLGARQPELVAPPHIPATILTCALGGQWDNHHDEGVVPLSGVERIAVIEGGLEPPFPVDFDAMTPVFPVSAVEAPHAIAWAASARAGSSA